MEIWVAFDGKTFRLSPDPAVVQSGTLVTWRFQTNKLSSERIRWTVYFQHGSPFRLQASQFTTTTSSTAGQHTGTTGATSADDPGDYKYGVRAEDPLIKHILGDDDPRLIVTP
jgi:hypothetical protein